MVARRLRRRIGRGRVVGRRLREQALRPERAVDLVGGDVQETKRRLRLGFEPRPVRARRFEQREGADDVGLHEVARARDRPVDVALGREVHHGVGPELGEEPVHRGAVADVGAGEAVVRQVRDRPQAVEVAGVGELVDVQHLDADLAREVADQGRADEARAPGDEDALHREAS